MRVLTPVRALLRVSPAAGEAIGPLRMRGQACDLDPTEGAAFAETLEHARGLQLAVADAGRFLDPRGLRAGEEAADVVAASHLLTPVLPPTTTLVTSRAEHPNIR